MSSQISTVELEPYASGEVVQAIVRLRSKSPGMIMNRTPDPTLDRMMGGELEGGMPEGFDPSAPLHRSARIEHVLPREHQLGEEIIEMIERIPGGGAYIAPEGSHDETILHLGERVSTEKLHTSNGQIVLPANMIMAALVNAGRYVKRARSKMTWSDGSCVSGLIKLDFHATPLFLDGGEPGVVPWKPFTLNALAPREKGKRKREEITVTRPRIPHWNAEFKVKFNPNKISLSVVEQLFTIAGHDVGFGDFRPGLESARTTRGRFGRFFVDKFERVKV